MIILFGINGLVAYSAFLKNINLSIVYLFLKHNLIKNARISSNIFKIMLSKLKDKLQIGNLIDDIYW